MSQKPNFFNYPMNMYTKSVSNKYDDETPPFPYHLKHTDQVLWCIDQWRMYGSRKQIIDIIKRIAPGLLQDPRRSAYDKCYIINGILNDFYVYGADRLSDVSRLSKL